MNAKPNDDASPADAPPARLEVFDGAWRADWTDFAVVSFALPPAALAAEVPYDLELFDGCAWVSFVWFTLRALRPAGTGVPGRWACRPLSEHDFLNVRTYVRGAEGPGICFLAEWIPNRLSAWLGPKVYGLPYRYGRFTTTIRPACGTRSLTIEAPGDDAALALTLPTARRAAAPCSTGSLDAFLLERYQAYMFDGRRGRRFRVAHRPWRTARADWVRYDFGFVQDIYPWLASAEQATTHLCEPLRDVEMGRPHRTLLRSVPTPASTEAPTYRPPVYA